MVEKIAKRDWRSSYGSTRLILASLAALAALLVAWFAPLPRLVLSDEEKAAARMPDDRAAVISAQAAFQKAESAYKSYIGSHDVGGAISGLESVLPKAQASPGDATLVGSVQHGGAFVLDYMSQLHAYAQAGEVYFASLSHYDDELMAWTRSLGSESDALQSDTWPIVEYLKVYPTPVGESADYANISAAQVASDTNSLKSHLIALQTSAPANNPSAISLDLNALSHDIVSVRNDGRSVEYRESLHAQYNQLLSQYDGNVQLVATGSNGQSLSSGRFAFATGFDILLGAICVAGIAALLLARRPTQAEEAG